MCIDGFVNGFEPDTLPTFDMARLAHKYETLSEWRMPMYKLLAQREKDLSVWEAAQLGLAFMTRLIEVRERRLKRKMERDQNLSWTDSIYSLLIGSSEEAEEAVEEEALIEKDIVDVFHLKNVRLSDGS